MHIPNYRVNLDALLARIVYRWQYQSVAVAFLAVTTIGLYTGLIPPFWKSQATLIIEAAEGATILVDEKPWPHAIYAGQHSVIATLPDGRSTWTDIDLLASEALTLTLPAGLPGPLEQSLPPAAPGTHIDHVWWADGGWRVRSVADPVPLSEDVPSYGPTPTPAPAQTVAVSNERVERLSTLDAYVGLADQVRTNNRLLEAVYRPDQQLASSSQTLGTVEVRGWGAGLTVPISQPVTLLRFSPTGTALVMVEQVPTGGEQVYVMTQDAARIPAVAVPGHITRLSWHPDGSAVVLHSVQGEHLTLTLVRLTPSIIAAAIADLPSRDYAGAIVPLTWDTTQLLWVAPDQEGTSALWRTPLSTLLPERVQPMEARALTRLADGSLRVLTLHGSSVVIGRYQGDIFIGETMVSGVTPASDLMGIWQGDELLIQGGDQAWLLGNVGGEQ